MLYPIYNKYSLILVDDVENILPMATHAIFALTPMLLFIYIFIFIEIYTYIFHKINVCKYLHSF